MALQKEVGEHYEMSRCLLIESGLPDNLWNYAVQTSAYVRNRCYNRHTKKTAYEHTSCSQAMYPTCPNYRNLDLRVLLTSKRRAKWNLDVSKGFS